MNAPLHKIAYLAAMMAGFFATAAHAADPVVNGFENSASCGPIASVEGFGTQGWGYNAANERYQPNTGITKENVDQLKVKWAYALEGGPSPHSMPVVSEDTVFVGTQSGQLHALDRATGCVRWTYESNDEIRSAIIHGEVSGESGTETLLFFSTSKGKAHAVLASTGELRWETDVTDHSMSMLTGTPSFHDGRLYVPVSSSEVVMAAQPWYGCCTFRGAVVALDAASGAFIWRTHVVPEPQETGTHYLFVQNYGPSGAPIWSAPTMDVARGLVLVGTGENYSAPASDMSDAIVAMDMETGEIRWHQQYLAGDTFNVSCGMPKHPNCQMEKGPDLDFGAPPIVTQTRDGTDIVLAGQKSGGVYGMNPDTGERIWERVFGRGGMIGGIHWGMAVNPGLNLVYAPVSDMKLPFVRDEVGIAAPGLYALDIATGALAWATPMQDTCGDKDPCDPGLSAAIAATPDLVFSGGLDGVMRAFDAATGVVVWSFDAWREFPAVGGALTPESPQAIGGTFDVHGPLITGNMMFVLSGYAHQSLRGGNALLAFELQEQE
jgi:polyvinyl alcohol dehydrogenase (cytochrome)